MRFISPSLQRVFATFPRVNRPATTSNLGPVFRQLIPVCCSFASRASDSDKCKPAEDTPTKTRRRKKKVVEKQELLRPLFPFEGTREVLAKAQARSQHSEPRLTVDRITNRNRRTYHIRLDDGTSYRLPSVTTILEETKPLSRRFMLQNWAKGLIKEHGKQGFDKIKRDIQDNGTRFHQCLENKLLEASENVPFSIKSRSKLDWERKTMEQTTTTTTTATDSSQPPPTATPLIVSPAAMTADATETLGSPVAPLSDVVVAEEEEEGGAKSSSTYFQSVAHILDDISDVFALESVVAHLELGYTGTFDCVAKYKGELCLIDWKTSSKPKPLLADCYDFPLQAAAYAGAINQSAFYPFKVYNALIVVAYSSGDPAHCHFLSQDDCLEYWFKWNLRLEQYQTRFAQDLSEIYI